MLYSRSSALLLSLVFVLVAPAAFAQIVTLQNDGFLDGGSAAFQGGFVAGEMGASRLTPPGPLPAQVLKVRFLFGSASGTRDVILRIYDDTALTDSPGAQLFFGTYSVTGSSNAFSEIDLSGDNVFVPGTFRVALEFTAAGEPSIARDTDGTIDVTKNYILASGIGWVRSSLFGLQGDWVIRADVTAGGGGGGDEPEILSIADVGNDQGRQVRIRFAASAEDVIGSATPVFQYEAYRRIDALPKSTPPPSSDRFEGQLGKRIDGWEFAAVIPAHAEAIYNMVAPTLADSTEADGIHWSVFFVRAATAAPGTFFDSTADSGYSIDNLAPAAPQNLVLTLDQLTWDPASEPDFDYFSVYGSATSTLDAGAVLIAHTTQTTLDVGAQAHAFYLVTARDFAGNEGEAAATPGSVTAVGPPRFSGIAVQAHPNPFNPATTLTFRIDRDGPVTLQLFDPRGRVVRTLLDGEFRVAGQHQMPFRGDLASGVYLLRMESRGQVATTKLGLVR